MRFGKSFFIFLVTLNFCLSVPADKFDWESHIADVIQDIQQKNDRFSQTNNLDDLPTYDFIVIGSGSGGSTCTAGILEKKPNARILMIEAGSYDIEDRVFDYFYGAFWAGSKYDWNDLTVFETGLNRRLNVPNGFILGGSSAINYIFWIRGDPNDFNSWASITGDNSWTYENMIPHFKKVEKYGESSSTDRGDSGDIFVTREFSESTFADELYNIISKNLSFIKNKDYNARSPDGIAYSQFNAKPQGRTKGIRQDAFRAQLFNYLNRPTFNILTSTYGDKVVLNDANNEVKYLIIQRNGVKYKVRATKDYIIAAGATRTPLFLMRSGIGDRDYLTTKGIETRVNLRGVGKNLHHHPTTSFGWAIPGGSLPDNILFNIVTDKITLYGFDFPKHQLIFYQLVQNPIISPSVLFAAAFQAHLRETGDIQLNTTDPTDGPIIRLNTFTNPLDLADHVEGMERLEKIGASLKGKYVGNQVFPVPGSDYAEYARSSCTIFHACGTARMGKRSDPDAVVSSKLKVIGVKNLRVVDASVMPHVTSFNTNCPTMTIGMKAADIILKDRY